MTDRNARTVPPAPPGRPYKRSPSPNPAPLELAPPESVQAARREAHEAVAEQDRRQAEENASLRAELDAIRKTAKPIDYKGLALVITAVGGIAGTVSAGRCSSVPPGVLEAPAQIEQLRGEVGRLRGRADALETDRDEDRRRWRKTDDKAEDALGEVAKLKKRVPEPVTP